MKAQTKKIIVLLLISILIVEEAESLRVRRVCRKVCSRVCRFVKKGISGRVICWFVCRKICRGKRQALDAGTHATPLPADFNFYDINENNFIEIEEIAGTLGHSATEIGLMVAFNQTDVNNDMKLSFQEFMADSSAFNLADPVTGTEGPKTV